VQVLLGQKYFGWGEEPVKMLYDAVAKHINPPNPIIDSGVDVVTKANVDQYEAEFKKAENGG
jgi:ABC-type sugar transport system substrate-binding protein